MSIGSDKFRTKKRDQSPYLFHFTSGTEYEAAEVLKTILQEKKLRAKNKDYICFTASPITQVGEFFETLVNSTGQPMYQPYGIGFSRDILISRYGAKNVIYGDDADEKAMAASGMSWRFLKLDVDLYDFEWLREWRLPGKEFDFSGFPKEHIIVIAPTDDKLLDFVTRDYCVQSWDYDEKTGEKFEDLVEMYDRSWKGVSIDFIRNKNLVNDYQVSGSTVTQIIGADMFEEVSEQMSRKTKELNEVIAKSWEETFRETLNRE
jgi:hypothetical protein